MSNSSVDNALRLLTLIGERRVLRVAEASEALGVARSTAHRLLAALSPTELDRRYSGRDLPARTTTSVADFGELLRELAEVRRVGYALNLEEGESGVCAVGAAVRDLAGFPLAAIAIVIPASRM